jgi:hypothetical protein
VPVFGLLEILARVHQLGLVHRDLKPSNVMVGPEGRVTLLDFGLARGAAHGWTLTPAGGLVGTPRYLAPEQIMGARADARADLYAVGIMVFEAMTGSLPHGNDDAVTARLAENPRAIAQFAPDVPTVVDDTIQRLIARRPADRWDSAAEVLGALRGTAGGDSAEGLARAAVRSVLAGKERPPEDASQPGERLVVAGESPFESLAAMVPANPDLTLAELAAHLSSTLDAVQREGGTLVVDDLERVDPWSRDLLSRYGGPMGSRPRSPETLLGEVDLMQLFHGPERLFHLQTDGAHELARRTAGRPSEIEVEVAAWTRAGLVRWVGRRMVITRAALDTLRFHLRGFLRVRDQSGRKLVFRYYDPRVFRDYLPTCTSGELEMVFGPIDSFIAEGRDGTTLLRFQRERGALATRSFVMPVPSMGTPAASRAVTR